MRFLNPKVDLHHVQIFFLPRPNPELVSFYPRFFLQSPNSEFISALLAADSIRTMNLHFEKLAVCFLSGGVWVWGLLGDFWRYDETGGPRGATCAKVKALFFEITSLISTNLRFKAALNNFQTSLIILIDILKILLICIIEQSLPSFKKKKRKKKKSFYTEF